MVLKTDLGGHRITDIETNVHKPGIIRKVFTVMEWLQLLESNSNASVFVSYSTEGVLANLVVVGVFRKAVSGCKDSRKAS